MSVLYKHFLIKQKAKVKFFHGEIAIEKK